MADKIKDKSKVKKPVNKVVEIHKDKKLKDIYTYVEDQKKIEALKDILMVKLGFSNVTLPDSNTIFFIRPLKAKIFRKTSLSKSQPNMAAREDIVCQAIALDFVEETTRYDDMWVRDCFSHLEYNKRANHWKSLGVKYIVDYNIQRIIDNINDITVEFLGFGD